MISKREYLSDEELEQLILEIEQEELVPAPPDLMESILARAEKGSKESKVREFRAYCLRVVMSVAAALLMVFTLPGLMDTQLSDRIPEQEVSTQEMPKEIPTKEETLSETGIFRKALGGINIFSEERELDIFK